MNLAGVDAEESIKHVTPLLMIDWHVWQMRDMWCRPAI
jgi:hypothetical protein